MRSSLRRQLAVAAAMATMAVGATACTTTRGSADGRPVVAASFFPLADILTAVGGDTVHVVGLVPPGQDAHEFEPTPKQLAALERADAIVYLGSGFQPGLEKQVDALPTRVRRVDLLRDQQLLPVSAPLAGTEGEVDGEAIAGATGDQLDPHVWLDPVRMAEMATRVATMLRDLEPGAAATIDANLAAYTERLDELHRAFVDGLARCSSTVLVTSHRAFGYLAARYHLAQVSIAGVSSTDEPSARTLRAVARYVQSHDIATVFFQQNLPSDLARTVAAEAGAGVAVLDPLEAPTHEQLAAATDYVGLMRANLATLRQGLGCS